ncbi:leucine-rich repeat extensin-like protein 5 [Triticum aestivum]|uniref:leucine-rich repeat extensin-like protein 5 n=1 Tax=Triticum aestivum TaxID=4565 RepID=UPI001D023E39|nr:leucine-rich repeat extensin-like protein 5 [Triticum aestivum]
MPTMQYKLMGNTKDVHVQPSHMHALRPVPFQSTEQLGNTQPSHMHALGLMPLQPTEHLGSTRVAPAQPTSVQVADTIVGLEGPVLGGCVPDPTVPVQELVEPCRAASSSTTMTSSTPTITTPTFTSSTLAVGDGISTPPSSPPSAATHSQQPSPEVTPVPNTLLTAASSLEPAVETLGEGVATSPSSPPSAVEPAPRPQLGLTPTRRSCRHTVAEDGSMDTYEDSLTKAMRRKAAHNLDNRGYL